MDALHVLALDHVGVAVPAPTHPLLALTACEPPAGRLMPSGVRVARFGPAAQLELVWPGRAGTPVDGFLARRGAGLHHVALRVEGSLAGAVAQLAAAGFRSVGPVEPSADGRPSLFLHPGGCGGVLVELVEGAP